MRNIILLTILFAFTSQSKAQNQDFPENPEEGKCYLKNFNLDEEYKWNEVDCEEVKKINAKFNAEEFFNKIKKYQTELKNAGYKVVISGALDNKTIAAHHRYLKQRKKAERIKLRAEKKALRTLKRKKKSD